MNHIICLLTYSVASGATLIWLLAIFIEAKQKTFKQMAEILIVGSAICFILWLIFAIIYLFGPGEKVLLWK